MTVSEKIQKAFHSSLSGSIPTDEYIEANTSILEIVGSPDPFSLVPAYMLWCLKRPMTPSLVPDGTISALAEYGRSKDTQNPSLNFKFRCSEAQSSAVVAFLKWCEHGAPFSNQNQIERALRNWQHAANPALKQDAPSARPLYLTSSSEMS